MVISVVIIWCVKFLVSLCWRLLVHITPVVEWIIAVFCSGFSAKYFEFADSASCMWNKHRVSQFLLLTIVLRWHKYLGSNSILNAIIACPADVRYHLLYLTLMHVVGELSQTTVRQELCWLISCCQQKLYQVENILVYTPRIWFLLTYS